MKLILFLAIALGCRAQVFLPPGTTPAVKAAPLPDWYGGGAGFGPHWSTWASLAHPVSQSQAAFSYTVYESVLKRGTVPTVTTTTGLGTIVRSYVLPRGTFYIFAIATVGASTTSTATTGAFTGEGMALWKWKNGYTAEFIASEETAGGVVTRTFKLGWGKTFGVK